MLPQVEMTSYVQYDSKVQKKGLPFLAEEGNNYPRFVVVAVVFEESLDFIKFV